MKIGMGGNLRRLRQGKGLTQEQLAEAFGISAQAVSRWENDQAYPDITLLPGLAMYFGVSADELLGMEHLKSRDRLNRLMSEIYTLAREGKMEEAIALCREGLRVYPENEELLMALGEALARRTDDPAALSEAIVVEERVLDGGRISAKAWSTTAVNLLFLYRKSGDEEKARALIKRLPHIWESREMMKPEICGEEEYTEALKEAVRKALALMCLKIDGCERRRPGETPEYVQLGVEFENGMSDGEMLERIGRFLECL